MKKIFWIILGLCWALQIQAQTNEPVRLALISETTEVAVAADVLTAQLSGNPGIHLLERDEIEKAYQEQGMSVASRDDLKLGRILGADGLLLLNVLRTPEATNLTARLIAVKPGVVLTDGRFPWPLKDASTWSKSVAAYLDSLLPKLTLPAKDAIPISVVNLRSAIASAEAAETEYQLKLLTIQRLSQERQIFVLERQKMQMLGEEKNLNADESAFWDGKYLLDGVVDQNGFSSDTITVNARLTPPKGGAPIVFKVSGSRTNLGAVVNQLALKVMSLLQVNATALEWLPAEEAKNYFEEANWALRWGIWGESQAAADSAWALGKQDFDCAVVRVKSYLSEASADVETLQESESGFGPGYDVNGAPVGPPASEADVQSDIKAMQAEHPFGLVFKETQSKYGKDVRYVFTSAPPDPGNIDRAFHALEFYYEFSRNSSNSLLKVASAASNWKNSEWYDLGLEDLVVASRVLQSFDLDPEAQKTVADRLAELRAMARSVAGWISSAPAVHDSYFVGGRIVTRDELANIIEENPNIFRCEVDWSCYWQETPEDAIALYRELISSPVFCYLHEGLWFRPLERPRMIAWNNGDHRHLATVWDDFMRETDASTNMFMRMEGKAMQLRDASNEIAASVALTNFFEAFSEDRCAFVNNNVEVLYLNWGVDDLIAAIGGYKEEGSGGIESSDDPAWKTLRTLGSDDLAKLSEQDAGCRSVLAFEKQKKIFERKHAV